MMKQQAIAAVRAALESLNEGDRDYSPATVAGLVGLPVGEVSSMIVKAGWCEMGHEHGLMGFYEMA